MATHANRPIAWVKSEGLGNPENFYDPAIKEANSQSFVIGDLVTVTPGTGTVSEFAANGRHLSGIAQTDATNVTSGNIAIRIQKILANEVYEMNLTNNGSDVTGAITHLGKVYGLKDLGSGVWAVDTNSGTVTNANVQVVGFKLGPDYDENGTSFVAAVGDVNPRVYVKFITNDGTNSQILDYGGM